MNTLRNVLRISLGHASTVFRDEFSYVDESFMARRCVKIFFAHPAGDAFVLGLSMAIAPRGEFQ